MFDWLKRRGANPPGPPAGPPGNDAAGDGQPRHTFQGSADASLLMGVSVASQGRFDEALTYFDRVVALEPGNPDGHAYRGQALAALGRADDALRAFGDAIRLDSHHGQALLERGLLHQRRGNVKQAIADYSLAAERAQDQSQQIKARYNRALLYEKAGDIEQAEQEYQTILDRQRGYPPASNSLAAICLQRGVASRDAQWIQIAVNILTTAIDAHPDDLICRLTRGQAFAVVSKFAEAKADLQAALQSDNEAVRAQATHMLAAISKA